MTLKNLLRRNSFLCALLEDDAPQARLNYKFVYCSSCFSFQAGVTRKPRKLLGSEKPFVEARLNYKFMLCLSCFSFHSGRLRPGSKVLFGPQQGEENFGNLREYSRVSIVTVDHVSLLELVLRVFRG